MLDPTQVGLSSLGQAINVQGAALELLVLCVAGDNLSIRCPFTGLIDEFLKGVHHVLQLHLILGKEGLFGSLQGCLGLQCLQGTRENRQLLQHCPGSKMLYSLACLHAC